MECHRAARRAVDLGYRNVYIMPAGIDGWSKAGMPLVKGEKPGSLEGTPK